MEFSVKFVRLNRKKEAIHRTAGPQQSVDKLMKGDCMASGFEYLSHCPPQFSYIEYTPIFLLFMSHYLEQGLFYNYELHKTMPFDYFSFLSCLMGL